jgi:hypothetical protein
LLRVGELRAAAEELRERFRLDLDGLFEQPVEEETAVVGAAAVEAEGEFVQVVVELRRADGALVGAEQPALERQPSPSLPPKGPDPGLQNFSPANRPVLGRFAGAIIAILDPFGRRERVALRWS